MKLVSDVNIEFSILKSLMENYYIKIILSL